MILDFGEIRIGVSVMSSSTRQSPHTGAMLEKLEAETSIEGEAVFNQLSGLLSKPISENIPSIDQTGKIIKRWKIILKQSSYQTGNPIYHFSLELEEVEELKLISLVIGDLEFHPYFYKEEFHDGRLAIEAKVLISEEQHDQLKPLYLTHDDLMVIRHGINDTPQAMDLNFPFWSRQEPNFKHVLSLSEPLIDKEWPILSQAFICVNYRT
jgi:hypothetical protein